MKPCKPRWKPESRSKSKPRAGIIAILAAIMLTLLLLCVACAIDYGTVVLVRTELQGAADAAALAAASQLGYSQDRLIAKAREYTNANKKIGGPIELLDSEVELGIWNRTTHTFRPDTSGNAVRVTTRSTGQPFTFGRVFTKSGFNSQAKAIASAIPRDIVFVIDLSGSMNDDTEQAWATSAIDAQFSGVGTSMVNDLMYDLYGSGVPADTHLATYLQSLGYAVAAPEFAYAVLTMDSGHLASHGNSAYRIYSWDGEAQRQAKAYAWMRGEFLPSRMNGVQPSFSQTNYWNRYLDYVTMPIIHSVAPPDPPPVQPAEPQPPPGPDYSSCWVETHPPPPPHHTHSHEHSHSHSHNHSHSHEHGHSHSHSHEHSHSHSHSHEHSHSHSHSHEHSHSHSHSHSHEHTHTHTHTHTHSHSAPSHGPIGAVSHKPDWLLAWQKAFDSSLKTNMPMIDADQELAFNTSATTGVMIVNSITGATGYYEPSCTSAIDFAYNAAYAAYTAAHDYWLNIAMPAYYAAVDHYYNVYLPAYLADAKSKGAPPYSRGQLPPAQMVNEYGTVERLGKITGFTGYTFNNPNKDLRPGSSDTLPLPFFNRFGYGTYTQFMSEYDRNLKPDGLTYVPLSLRSGLCPEHSESVGDNDTGYSTLSFPPRTQPIHAAKRSIIRAIKVIEKWNQGVEQRLRDHISIVSFDHYNPSTGYQAVLVHGLTGDYDTAMTACTRLQAVGDKLPSTAIEPGMIKGREHVTTNGRPFADKVMVLLTDGLPNQIQSSPSTIVSYVSSVPAGERDQFYFSDRTYSGDREWFNGPLMQAHQMKQLDWDVFAVGLGAGADPNYLNRMATLGGTADIGSSLGAGGNPAEYENKLTEIFKKIIFTPRVTLVD